MLIFAPLTTIRITLKVAVDPVPLCLSRVECSIAGRNGTTHRSLRPEEMQRVVSFKVRRRHPDDANSGTSETAAR